MVTRLILLCWILATATVLDAQNPACTCEREDGFSVTKSSATCSGGVACFTYSQENFTPIVEGEENGQCKGALGTVCNDVQIEKVCKYDGYIIRIHAAGCSLTCMNGKPNAKVTIDNPWDQQTSQQLSPGGSVPFNFSITPNELACDTGPKFITLTVSAAGKTVYEVQRRVKCANCPNNT